MERRLHTRHRARTTVYVVMSGRKSRICKAKNLSANGVFVETDDTTGLARRIEPLRVGGRLSQTMPEA